MKNVILPIVVIMISLSFAQAQQMTMQECVRVALDNNLTVKRSVYNVESNRVGLLSAKGNFLPTLNFNVSGSQNYGRNLNPVTYQYFQGITQTVNASLNGSLVLFNGLRYQHTYRQ